MPVIEHGPTGHKYPAFQMLSSDEAAIISARMDKLAAADKAMATVDKRLKRHEEKPDPALQSEFESLMAENKALIDQVLALREELAGIVNLTLRNCFLLTEKQIGDMPQDEAINIVFQLASKSKR
jgi:hypothetical protein